MGPWQIVVHSELILYFFWEGERRPHNLQPSSTLPPLFQTLPHNEVLIGYFLITPSLFFKARLSVKLLLNLVFTWMVLHLASFSKWEYLELSNSLCCCHLLETGPPFVQCVIIWPTQISSRLQGKWNTFPFDYFKTLSNGPPTPPGIEPATSFPAFKRSAIPTELVLARPQVIHMRFWPSFFCQDGWILASFFFAFLLTETRTSYEFLPRQNYYMATKRSFSCGTNAGYPERARWTRVANQNAGFASSYPLADLAIQ